MSKIFTLPALNYAFNAVEPAIDALTMEIHHDRHHAAYVTNLNKALESYPDFSASIEDLLKNINAVPEVVRTAIRNNGGGHLNHSLFWELLAPGGSKSPGSALEKDLMSTFGSFDAFQTLFSSTALTRFGSGWAWLVLDSAKKLQVYSTANQDSPLMEGHTPILSLDVWEHAYYLKYQNKRADYIKAFWSVVNWDTVSKFYLSAR
jgi:Fe-Mn family superoxide dismutase